MSKICIGHMGGDGWYATLDFDMGEAVVVQRGKGGTTIGPIATVPLGTVIDPADDDHDPTLDPDDETNKDLMAIVCVPDMRKAIRYAVERLKLREDESAETHEAHKRWVEDMEILRELSDALENAETVPQ